MNTRTLIASLAPLALAAAAHAQVKIDWHTIDSGGGASTGGGLVLTGTIGQHDAGVMTGPNIRLEGGFWPGPMAVVRCGLADVAGPGQVPGPDGQLTADDIIVFIGFFFAADARGDVAGPGQTIGADGQFTADDIIVFITAFFQAC